MKAIKRPKITIFEDANKRKTDYSNFKKYNS
jgi:hypothetical protein